MINCNFITEPNFSTRYLLSFSGGHLNDIYFENCKFNSKSRLISCNGFYSGKFLNCTIENIDSNNKSFIYANSKPNGHCNFNNCTLKIPSNIILFDGTPYNIDYTTNYAVRFIKTKRNGNEFTVPPFSSNKNIRFYITV